MAKIDPAQMRLFKEYKHTRPFLGCRFDASGKFVFAGCEDNTVQRVEIETGKLTPLVGHKSWVRGLAAVDKLILSAGYDGKVIAWPVDAEKPEPKWTIEAHKGWVRAVVVSPDRKTFATCGNDNTVRLWNLEDGKPLRTLAGHQNHVYHVAFHPDGKSLVSGDLKGVLKVWDLAKGEMAREMDASVLYKYDQTFGADHGGVRSMAFRADGGMLACAGITDVSNAFAGVGKPAVVLFDWATGKRVQLLRPKEDFNGTAWGVVFHPEGYVIASGGGNGGAIWVWKGSETPSVFTLKHPQNARDLDLHPDGTKLAAPFADGFVRVFDLTPK